MCVGNLLRVSSSRFAVGAVFQRRPLFSSADYRAEFARQLVGFRGDLRAGGGVVFVYDAGVHLDDRGDAGERM